MVVILFLLPTLHFFYSSDCGHCYDVLYGIIEDIKEGHKINVVVYDILESKNYRKLEEFEARYGSAGDEIPIVFFKEHIFYGNAEIEENLPQLVKKHIKIPEIIEAKTEIVFFTKTGCLECQRSDALLKAIKKEFPGLKLVIINIREDSAKVLAEGISDWLGIPDDKRLIAPTVCLDSTYLIKENIKYQQLKNLIEKHHNDSILISKIPQKYFEIARDKIINRFKRLTILPVIFAGLIDGINPCAFATLVFFVAYLVYLGRRRSDIVKLTFAFAFGIFISYFSIGLGAYKLLGPLLGDLTIKLILTKAFALFAFILAVISSYDFILAKERKESEIKLQLPRFLKRLIHIEIKKTGYFWLSGILTGLVVSILEFACTGQVYLPTITLVASTSLRSIAIPSLIIYNIAFVMPVIIIGFAAGIISSEEIAGHLHRQLPLTKLLTSLLFFAIGLLLLLFG